MEKFKPSERVIFVDETDIVRSVIHSLIGNDSEVFKKVELADDDDETYFLVTQLGGKLCCQHGSSPASLLKLLQEFCEIASKLLFLRQFAAMDSACSSTISNNLLRAQKKVVLEFISSIDNQLIAWDSSLCKPNHDSSVSIRHADEALDLVFDKEAVKVFLSNETESYKENQQGFLVKSLRSGTDCGAKTNVKSQHMTLISLFCKVKAWKRSVETMHDWIRRVWCVQRHLESCCNQRETVEGEMRIGGPNSSGRNFNWQRRHECFELSSIYQCNLFYDLLEPIPNLNNRATHRSEKYCCEDGSQNMSLRMPSVRSNANLFALALRRQYLHWEAGLLREELDRVTSNPLQAMSSSAMNNSAETIDRTSLNDSCFAGAPIGLRIVADLLSDSKKDISWLSQDRKQRQMEDFLLECCKNRDCTTSKVAAFDENSKDEWTTLKQKMEYIAEPANAEFDRNVVVSFRQQINTADQFLRIDFTLEKGTKRRSTVKSLICAMGEGPKHQQSTANAESLLISREPKASDQKGSYSTLQLFQLLHRSASNEVNVPKATLHLTERLHLSAEGTVSVQTILSELVPFSLREGIRLTVPLLKDLHLLRKKAVKALLSSPRKETLHKASTNQVKKLDLVAILRYLRQVYLIGDSGLFSHFRMLFESNDNELEWLIWGIDTPKKSTAASALNQTTAGLSSISTFSARGRPSDVYKKRRQRDGFLWSIQEVISAQCLQISENVGGILHCAAGFDRAELEAAKEQENQDVDFGLSDSLFELAQVLALETEFSPSLLSMLQPNDSTTTAKLPWTESYAEALRFLLPLTATKWAVEVMWKHVTAIHSSFHQVKFTASVSRENSPSKSKKKPMKVPNKKGPADRQPTTRATRASTTKLPVSSLMQGFNGLVLHRFQQLNLAMRESFVELHFVKSLVFALHGHFAHFIHGLLLPEFDRKLGLIQQHNGERGRTVMVEVTSITDMASLHGVILQRLLSTMRYCSSHLIEIITTCFRYLQLLRVAGHSSSEIPHLASTGELTVAHIDRCLAAYRVPRGICQRLRTLLRRLHTKLEDEHEKIATGAAFREEEADAHGEELRQLLETFVRE